jgi:hypothetical protein
LRRRGLELPLASINFIIADVEAVRDRSEQACYTVRKTIDLDLGGGGSGYYFGETVPGMPVSIHPVSADAELRAPRALPEPVAA